jgi:hypothetical protein
MKKSVEITSKSTAYPQPLPYQGKGAKIKASLPAGERFGEGFSINFTTFQKPSKVSQPKPL